jgi:hypothetical protein
MFAIMLTHACDQKALDQDLAQWDRFAGLGKRPQFIVGPHELVYALALARRSGRDGKVYDGMRLLCHCELWEQEAADAGCKAAMGEETAQEEVP